MNLHERWRPDPLSWSSRIRRSRQRRPDGDMRHRDVMVLLHRSCDGPDNACSKNLRFCTVPKHNVSKTGRICTIVQVRLTPEIGCNLWVLSVQDMLGCRSSPLASELPLCANDDETPAPFEFRLGHRRPTSWLCPTTMAQPI